MASYSITRGHSPPCKFEYERNRFQRLSEPDIAVVIPKRTSRDAVMVNHAAALKGWIAMAIIASGVVSAQAGKVLIATSPVGKSHLMNLKIIAKELERRGNSVMVSVTASSSCPSSLETCDRSIAGYRKLEIEAASCAVGGDGSRRNFPATNK